MSDIVIVAVITAGSSLLLGLANLVVSLLQKRRDKKTGIKARLDTIEAKVDKLTEHNDLQYLSLLRLTVMDSDMPMSERLIAGREYIERGGNGDVKSYFKGLEASVNR